MRVRFARRAAWRHVSNLRRKLERVGLPGVIDRSRIGYLVSASFRWLGKQAPAHYRNGGRRG